MEETKNVLPLGIENSYLKWLGDLKECPLEEAEALAIAPQPWAELNDIVEGVEGDDVSAKGIKTKEDSNQTNGTNTSLFKRWTQRETNPKCKPPVLQLASKEAEEQENILSDECEASVRGYATQRGASYRVFMFWFRHQIREIIHFRYKNGESNLTLEEFATISMDLGGLDDTYSRWSLNHPVGGVPPTRRPRPRDVLFSPNPLGKQRGHSVVANHLQATVAGQESSEVRQLFTRGDATPADTMETHEQAALNRELEVLEDNEIQM